MKYLFAFTLIIYLNHSINTKKYKSGEITYTISLNKKTENTSKEINVWLKNARDINYNLIFNEKESEYSKINAMDNDADSSINLTEILAGGKNNYYYNSHNNENIFSRKVDDEVFLISLKSSKWKLTKENNKIDIYNCYKAIALNENGEETDIIAWYTLEIPLGYGPKYFNGLPGLILELSTKQGSFKATKIKLSEKEIQINKPIKGTKITYEEFKKRFSNIFRKD